MDQYNRLLKKKSKALNIFEKTKNKLQSVISDFRNEIEKNSIETELSEERIKEEELKMSENSKATGFLNSEIQKTQKTIEKINAIL